jgi:hypothetical protein
MGNRPVQCDTTGIMFEAYVVSIECGGGGILCADICCIAQFGTGGPALEP